jgi:hypothetical protein
MEVADNFIKCNIVKNRVNGWKFWTARYNILKFHEYNSNKDIETCPQKHLSSYTAIRTGMLEKEISSDLILQPIANRMLRTSVIKTEATTLSKYIYLYPFSIL